MIRLYNGVDAPVGLEADDAAASTFLGAVWIDLIRPTDAERALVQDRTGLTLPSHDALSEIETSSRLARRGDVLILSMPMSSRFDGDSTIVTPLGFVLTEKRLITIRYAEMRAFDHFAGSFQDQASPPTALQAFEGIAEAIVDRLADVLEQIGQTLDAGSRSVFRPEISSGTGGRRADHSLRALLQRLGRAGDLLSAIRDSLLGLGRIVGYLAETDSPAAVDANIHRLKIIRADIQSLNDFDQQLSNKVQFLLDATLGFISIQQNNIIKVLTVVSIIGIPPTLIAGIYGMNFNNMPELKWAYGYPFALGLMIVSGVAPLIWLWRRGWL